MYDYNDNCSNTFELSPTERILASDYDDIREAMAGVDFVRTEHAWIGLKRIGGLFTSESG